MERFFHAHLGFLWAGRDNGGVVVPSERISVGMALTLGDVVEHVFLLVHKRPRMVRR